MIFPVAKKSLGQHFLKDYHIINKITSNFESDAKAIFEIGPGPGVLTEYLSKKKLPFFVIEKDSSFFDLLTQYITEDQISIDDALKVDIDKIFKNYHYPDQDIWLVSNLPYNVSVPLYLKFLQIPSITYMTLMFQKEVADKIVPPSLGKETPKKSSLSIISEIYFDVETLIKVPPQAFSPPPKVDSKVISLVRKEYPKLPLSDFLDLEKFLRHLFNFKRKQLQKVLKSFYAVNLIETVLQQLNISQTIRAEDLTTDQVIDLFQNIRKKTRNEE